MLMTIYMRIRYLLLLIALSFFFISEIVNNEVIATNGSDQTVYFSFQDADITDVAKVILGDFLKVNYVIDPSLKGKINLSMVVPVRKEDAFSFTGTLLRLNRIGIVEDRGLYRLIPLKDMPKEVFSSQLIKPPQEAAIEIFTFKNIDTKYFQGIKALEGIQLLGRTFGIMPFYDKSILIAAPRKEDLVFINKWLAEIDGLYYKTRPEVFIYRPQNRRAADLVQMLQPLTKDMPPEEGHGDILNDARFIVDNSSNTIVIITRPSDYPMIEEMIRKVDRPKKQILIKAMIAEVELSEELGFGTRWILQNKIKIDIHPFKDFTISGPLELNAPIQKEVFTFSAIDSEEKIKLLLQALSFSGRFRIISNHVITVSDGEEARLVIGSQIPLAMQYSTSQADASITSSVQYRDIGVVLKVRPEVIGRRLFITISGEVSSIGSPVLVGGLGFQSLQKKDFSTKVLATGGDSIIVGGLIRMDQDGLTEGIPLLLGFPLTGSFSKESRLVETILILRPVVMDELS